MPSYAGIGARNTPDNILQVMVKTGKLLAKDGLCCNTGMAQGADQAFARGACLGNGALKLCLPWASYEQETQQHLWGNITKVVVDPKLHTEAYLSVQKYHPNPANLKPAVVKLHARNYLIIEGVEFVVCYSPNGAPIGGTGQAIRMASDMEITIYNLGVEATLEAFKRQIVERGL